MNETTNPQPKWEGEPEEVEVAHANTPKDKPELFYLWSILGGKYKDPNIEHLDIIGEINEFSTRTIETTYYALELCGLAPLQRAVPKDIERLDEIRGEDPLSAEADKIVDNFLLMYEIYDRLWNAYELCSEYSYTQLTKDIYELTDDVTGIEKIDIRRKRVPSCLREIQTMRNRSLIGRGVGRHSEGILRVLIAQEKGVKLPSPQRLKSVQ